MSKDLQKPRKTAKKEAKKSKIPEGRPKTVRNFEKSS